MKIFSKISVYFILASGVLLLLLWADVFPSFYDVRYQGFVSLAGAAIIILLPKAFRVSKDAPGAEKKNAAADLFQFWLAVAFMANTLGDLGLYQLYEIGFEYDKLIHFTTSLTAGLLIPVILRDRFELRLTSGMVVAFLIIIVGGVCWEFYEYACDHLLGTRIDGVYGLDVVDDTRLDLTFNALAAFCGLGVMIFIGKRDGMAGRQFPGEI